MEKVVQMREKDLEDMHYMLSIVLPAVSKLCDIADGLEESLLDNEKEA